MLNSIARAAVTKLFEPLAKLLLKTGVGPNAVTVIGTLGVCAGALIWYPQGQLFWGTVVITVFVFGDMLDGIMARLSGQTSRWGAFLDSTLDRLADAAVFGGLAIWFYLGVQDAITGTLALACLVFGSLVSYVRARAESIGVQAQGGIAERADRLVVVLTVTGLVGLGLPTIVLSIALAALVVACGATVIQRMSLVYWQLRK